MNKTTQLNTALLLLLIAIISLASWYDLNDFSALKNADGIVTDMRQLVLWDIRLPRILLAVLTGASLSAGKSGLVGKCKWGNDRQCFYPVLFFRTLYLVTNWRCARGITEFLISLFDCQKSRYNNDDFKWFGG